MYNIYIYIYYQKDPALRRDIFPAPSGSTDSRIG